MSDSLKALLHRVDATAPSIQSAAGAMMKHYDRSPDAAVVQWRDALQASKPDAWLPLLYVANEVLQNSKRNRGNKFLEAFSPILGQSLIFVCQHSDANAVEKVRRTVKIWGERAVFSVRFVNEVLEGLEPYRNNRGSSLPPATATATATAPPPATTTSTQQQQQANFSPSHVSTTPSPAANANSAQEDTDSDDAPMDIFNDDSQEVNQANDGPNGDSNDEDDDDDNNDDNDDDNMFGNSEGDGLKMDGLELNFQTTKAAAAATATTNNSSNNNNNNNDKMMTGGSAKRRRGSNASTASQTSVTKRSKRKSVLSTTSLVELWRQVAALEQSFDHSKTLLQGMDLPTTETLQNLVGDELSDYYKTILKYEERIRQERRNLHRIATERKALEQEAVRFLPWLEAALKQDQDDIQFCKTLQSNVEKFKWIHPALKEARDKRVAEDFRFQREQQEKERQKKEEEDEKKFREAALARTTEAKPGMVWNKYVLTNDALLSRFILLCTQNHCSHFFFSIFFISCLFIGLLKSISIQIPTNRGETKTTSFLFFCRSL